MVGTKPTARPPFAKASAGQAPSAARSPKLTRLTARYAVLVTLAAFNNARA